MDFLRPFMHRAASTRDAADSFRESAFIEILLTLSIPLIAKGKRQIKKNSVSSGRYFIRYRYVFSLVSIEPSISAILFGWIKSEFIKIEEPEL